MLAYKAIIVAAIRKKGRTDEAKKEGEAREQGPE